MKVLFIAYYFPPDSSSGSFRPLFFANHLTRSDYQIHVLTARVEHFMEEQGRDENLLSVLSEKVKISRCNVYRPREAVINFRNRVSGKITRTAAGSGNGGSIEKPSYSNIFQRFKDLVTGLLATPDKQMGWLPHCLRKGWGIIRRDKTDLIFATGGPWTGLLAASILKRFTNVPLVLDFRDPWVSNPTFMERPGLCQCLDRWIERFIVSSADVIVANTDELRKDFLLRYPKLREDQVFTITNGFEDYSTVMPKLGRTALTLTHTGALYFNRNPARLLQAIASLLQSGSVDKSEILLQFVGGIQVDDTAINSVLPGLIESGVVMVTPRVSYAEAKQYDQQADILLLIQPEFPLQVPRKLYEYMATRKKMLCIAERDSATSRIVEGHRLGYVAENNLLDIERCILGILEEWRSGTSLSIDDDRLDRFRNDHLTEVLKQAFGKACGRIPKVPPCSAIEG